MAISSLASRGVSVSATTYSGNMIIVNLTILHVNDNSLITCQALGNSSNTSIIQIRGQSIGGMFSTCTCDFVIPLTFLSTDKMRGFSARSNSKPNRLVYISLLWLCC